MKISSRRVTIHYSLIQMTYWMIHCVLFIYASLFLLDKGLSNSSIGIILALSYGFAALMQPVVASLFQKKGIRLNKGMAVTFLIGALISLLLLLPVGTVPMAVLFIGVLTLYLAIQPELNSLPKDFEHCGIHINFGLCRGLGSVAFSVLSLVIGLLMRRLSPSVLPAFAMALMLILVVLLHFFRAPEAAAAQVQQEEAGSKNIIRSHPRFGLFLLGVICLMIPQVFIDSFLTQIIQSLGGNSAHQGVTLALATVLELPTMMLYSRFSRRFGCGKMMLFAGWMWVVKNLVALLATSPEGMYLFAVFQLATMAVYHPALVEYVAHALPQRDYLKGLALAASANSVGCLVATSLGGRLIDMVGVKPSLGLVTVFAVIGAVLFTVAVSGKRKAC